MISTVVMSLTTALLLGPHLAQEDSVKMELKKLEGTWTVVAFMLQGKKIPEEEIKGVKMHYVFQGDKCAVKYGERTFAEATIKIDPDKRPKTLDLIATAGEGKGETLLGIYELTDDTLQIAYISGGKSRPKELGSKEAMVLTLKRHKP